MSNLKTSEARVTRNWLLVILAVFVALSLIYSLTVPLFEGPDEIWHYAFANHLASGGGLPVFDVNQPATFLRNGAHPPLYYVLIAALIAPIDRSDFPADYRFNLASPKITPGGSGTSPNLLIHTAREDFPFQNTALAGHLARLVSIALSTLTVLGVFVVARRLLRDDRLALWSTAFVAFIPQFVYGAALVNNDALAACAATWLLYALLRLMGDPRWRWAWLSGVLLGMTLLAKIGMIAVLPIPAVALLLMWWRSRNLRGASHIPFYVSRGLLIYCVAALIAGWWYARNFALYGDPLMWREWQVLTGTGRVPPTPIDFLRDMLGFFGLFWADFSLRVDRVLWPIFGVLVIAAIAGLVRRAIKRQWPALDGYGLLVGLIWLGLLIATAVRYSFSIYDIHGRLLYPALSIIGVLLVLGLSGWPRPKWVLRSALAILMSIAVLAPFVIIQPAYARPIVAALPAGVIKTSAQFGDVELLGYQVENDRVKAGAPIELVTYWRRSPSTAVAEEKTLHAVINLSEIGTGKSLGHGEAALGNDIYPSWAWSLNEIVATHVIFIAGADSSAAGKVELGVRGDSAALLPSAQGETIDLGRVAVQTPEACNQTWSTDATFGDIIKLIGYRIVPSSAVDSPAHIVLCWELIKPTTVDYTVFVHVTDANGNMHTSDSQPRGGTYPTSIWQTGEWSEDSHLIPQAVELPLKQITVGLYRLDSGERLLISGTNQTEFIISNPKSLPEQ